MLVERERVNLDFTTCDARGRDAEPWSGGIGLSASPRSGRNSLGIHRFKQCIKSRCRGTVGPSLHGESAKRTQSSGDTPFQQCIKITMSRRRRTKLARRVRKANV